MLCTIKFWVHLHTYKFMFSLQIAYLFLRINLVVRFASASLSSMIRRMASCQKFLRYSMGVTNNHPGRIYFGKKFQSECFIDICLLLNSRSISHFITERGEWRVSSSVLVCRVTNFVKKHSDFNKNLTKQHLPKNNASHIFKNNNIGMTRMETL